MKIICIGRNYKEHALELNNPVPEKPMIFMKPSTSILKNGGTLYYPEFTTNLHFEIELVLKISKNGKYISEKYAHTYYNEIGIGIDFTARDLQDECKKNGHPWEVAKAFDNAAALGEFINKDDFEDIHDISFSLEKNGECVQEGNSKDVIFSFDYLVAYSSQFFTLQKGDLIFTGTPKGVGPVIIGDTLVGKINKKSLLNVDIK